MAASHPYRKPELCTHAPQHEPKDGLRGAQVLSKLFVVGWSLLRFAVCAVRGLDVEGCAALVIVVAMGRSLVNTWSRFS